ncbi:DNA cytosine methyltransferase [Nocardia seriolae]|uniref:DNA (cytosine-5-)-methyltransferase n=2 Tax=Nocardia seriolae TaxID=37332 RepID=A0ABC8AQN7_9NOCA|nr:DNA (cytosine-5-)-methyltransferase [Nocardia seriolae]APA96684.1 DNA (cytosine-5-)-methyltransferase [Nocardia seriolae]WKY51004.1 DNA (cytosine-5-)-methyltransferase [Nocardia seriolae]WNJ57658.1 DNA (cytosine-5-)-methyltransferase [Nocardia seriolae]BEK90295.1 DNA cytosine methyltransferase [Nocardia seriolae]BEK93874.1 DNA cytosine methyltransferase [Nocardia seriolae]
MTSALDLVFAPAAPDVSVKMRERIGKAVSANGATKVFEVAEFFAGIGLARLGLEHARNTKFKVKWANDLDPDKEDMYLRHFGEGKGKAHYHLQDIRVVAGDIKAAKVPRNLSLAWASFPCTDLSLAGGRQGLAGQHSSTFFDFTDVLKNLGDDRPPVVAIENVNGFATSHRGADIKEAVSRLNDLDYSVDVVTLDARRWVPQSRPRLFLIAAHPFLLTDVKQDERRDTALRPSWLDPVLDSGLRTHRAELPEPPALLTEGWTDLVDDDHADGVEWWDETRTAKFCSELSPVQSERVGKLAEQAGRRPQYRTAYRRTRNGKPAWEIRDGDVAGCLRTARGGSSKQAVVRIQGESLRVRWMTAREYAKLMGAPDYRLPDNRNQSIMGFGDAVCVNAVQWLAEEYLGPLLSGDLAR